MEKQIKISVASEDYIPQRAKPGDAGCDLKSRVETIIPPHMRAGIPVGIQTEIPEGYVGLIFARSGLALNYGIQMINGVGVVDPGYRGEYKVAIYNSDDHNAFKVNEGDRIAQLVIVPLIYPIWQVVGELSDSERGTVGFGSTGV